MADEPGVVGGPLGDRAPDGVGETYGNERAHARVGLGDQRDAEAGFCRRDLRGEVTGDEHRIGADVLLQPTRGTNARQIARPSDPPHVFEAADAPELLGIFVRRHRHPPRREKLGHHQIPALGPDDANGEVGFAASEVEDANGTIELDANLRVTCAETDEGRRDEDVGDAGRHAETDHALDRHLERRGLSRETELRPLHLFGGRHQELGGSSRKQPFTCAIEETRAEELFHRDQAAAECRGVEAEATACAAQSSFSVEREEEPDVVPPRALTARSGRPRTLLALRRCNHVLPICGLNSIHAILILRIMNTSRPLRPQSPLHVILGAGQIGALVRDHLLARGERVRQVRRGVATLEAPNLEHARGDISDFGFAAEACAGAGFVYDCTNPNYDQWDTHLFPLARGALVGARAAAAVLVAVDNVYMYGRPTGPLREDSKVAPISRKGELRARLAEERLAAHHAGEVRVVLARGSDWIGPGVTHATVFGDRFFRRVFAGKKGECFGDPDMPHAYTYAHDVARALVTLGERPEAHGQVWHLPTNAALSTRATMTMLGDALAMPIEVARVPRLVIKTLGVFSSLVREVVEMAYQWDVPFEIDDSKFRAAFGATATPWGEVMSTTAAWAKQAYGARAAA